MHIVFQNIISRVTTIETKSPMRQKTRYKLLYLSLRFSVPVTRMEHWSDLVWLLVYKYNLREKPTFIEVKHSKEEAFKI